MSGFNLAVADKWGFVARVLKAPVVTTSDFIAGVARDQTNKFDVTLGRGQKTEHDVCNSISASATVGDAFNLAMADKYGFIARILDAPVVTAVAATDAVAPAWTTNPALVSAQFSGGVFSAKVDKNATVYIVGVPHGDPDPGPENAAAGKRSNGAAGYDSNFAGFASGVLTQISLTNIINDAGDARIQSFDAYMVGRNADGVLQAATYFVGQVTIDGPAAFPGNTVGSADNATHQVTLGPYPAATDLYDDPSALVYVAMIDAAPNPITVGYSAPGANTITCNPGSAGNGSKDYMVRVQNSRGLIDGNTAKVSLTLSASSGQYTGTTGILPNNTNSPRPDGSPVKYSIYDNGDTNSPHNQIPDHGPIDAVTAGGRVVMNYGVSGTHWVRVTNPDGTESYSGKVLFA